MKKEYILLFALIVGLSAYLVVQSSGERHYTLPEPDTVKATDIKKFEIVKNGDRTDVMKKDGAWSVTDRHFPADKAKVEEMANAIEKLKVTALVSEKKDFRRYGLNEDNRIKVTAKGDPGRTTRVFIGKVAPTRNHTFVRLEDDNRVYHAAGNLERIFNRSVSEIRNKQVIEIDRDGISSMEIKKNGRKKRLEKSEGRDGAPPSWQSETGSKIDEQAVQSLLANLTGLTCSKYLDMQNSENQPGKNPFLTITLEGDQAVSLEVFGKNDQGLYPARSSQNRYPFLIEEFKAENIISDTDTIMGVKLEKSDEKAS
ncbi:MAG: DUF4340 domain-containing protein [Desulfobacteraceae bacterium]